MPPNDETIELDGFRFAGREAVVAARSSGFTLDSVGRGCWPGGYSL
jgi:hypothetical protein